MNSGIIPELNIDKINIYVIIILPHLAERSCDQIMKTVLNMPVSDVRLMQWQDYICGTPPLK